MPQNNCQKVKLLKIMEMLRQETDEQHPLRTGEICDRLRSMNISCDRRTLSKDMVVLNEQGFEVMHYFIDHEKAYYVADRSFSVPELKILIDAVQAATFITDKKTVELIDKIADLGGSNRAEILKKNMICFNTRKHSNEKIYYIVELLEDAISQRKKASFKYFDLNESGQRVFRKDGDRYLVEPMFLVYYEDNYYLSCYTPKYHDMTNYRLDRMDLVAIEEDPIGEEAMLAIQNTNMAEYTEQVFKMYGGDEEDVTIQFDSSLIGVVYDKFGEDTHMVRISETDLVATVRVQVSPTLFGWLAQFPGRMKIVSPSTVIDSFEDHISKIEIRKQ